MLRKRNFQLASCLVMLLMASVVSAADRPFFGAPPPNMLTNPNFDDGGGSFNGWFTFGNAFLSLPEEVALSAPASGKMFGNFSGGFNVSGIFQAFPASANQTFTFSGYSHVRSADPMVGVGLPDNNWVVMKMAFFDAPAGGNEIGGAEVIIADGTTPVDQWHFNTVTGTSPCGTQRVEALFLYLQPQFDPGAVFVDNASFVLEPATTVAVDVKPGGCPNAVNPNSNGKLPVAILGMDGFDVSQIDPSTVLLECVAPVATSFEDVGTPHFESACGCTEDGADGRMDMTLKFRTSDIAAILSGATEQELRLTGRLFDGTSIEGSDCIRVVPQGRGGAGGVGKPVEKAEWGAVKRIYR